MTENPYALLAHRLDQLPNAFPPTPDGAELRLLAKLFSPEEAALAAALRLTPETADELAGRLGGDPAALATQLKGMARRGLIKAGRAPGGLGFSLLPFVVGIFEMQGNTIDAELARLFEDYYQEAFGWAAGIQPPVHRVIPVNQTVRNDTEVHPYESAAAIISAANAWGVVDCICRKQKSLIGEACGHPLDVCMSISPKAGAFDGVPGVHVLDEQGALDTLRRAADAGLVHTVSNSQDGVWYICNCCTCGCALLRGMSELGVANVVARSAFVTVVDEDRCGACSTCADRCSFGAISVDLHAQVNATACAGCGSCVDACPDEALSLVRRPESEILPVPVGHGDWLEQRAASRGIDLNVVL